MTDTQQTSSPGTDAELPPPTLAQSEHEGEGRIGYGRYARYSPIGLAVVILVAIAAIWWWQDNPESSVPQSTAWDGREVPDVTLTTFGGNTVRLLDLEGSVVVLNFWAAWCAPCKEEMPVFQNVFEQTQITNEPIVFLGVNLKSDREEEAMKLLTDLGITYITGPDAGGEDDLHGPIQLAFGIPESYPVTIFIRPDGTIDTLRIGQIEEKELRDRIKHAAG